ncbi:MAG: glycosyltransferase [Eubacteriales bacterium]|nr:glycosyltransferase [Eubacteriales bacterium]
MKIVELNTFCGTGSTGRIALQIADTAAKHGAQTVIGFGAGDVPPQAETYALRIGGKIGRKWHGALRKLLDAEGYGSAHATRKLIVFLKAFQPDVIHLHNIHGCYLNHRLLFRYLRACGVPVIWTLHDCWPFTGHCAYFDRIGCNLWQTECHNCPQKHSYPTCIGPDGSRRNFRRRRTLFTAVAKLTLVTPCEWLRELLRYSFFKNTPARVVYNGVDLKTFAPTESDLRKRYGITERYLVLAVASEWEERKGLAYLPALAGKLGKDYRMAIIGLTQAQVDALPKSILGLTRTANVTELAQWYTAADCLVNPTLEDNMPMVNLEALACGTPVVAFDTGGCAEAIGDDCGIVVPKGDAETLLNAVQQVAPRREALRAACLARAERFSGDSSANDYWALYQEVVQ